MIWKLADFDSQRCVFWMCVNRERPTLLRSSPLRPPPPRPPLWLCPFHRPHTPSDSLTLLLRGKIKDLLRREFTVLVTPTFRQHQYNISDISYWILVKDARGKLRAFIYYIHQVCSGPEGNWEGRVTDTIRDWRLDMKLSFTFGHVALDRLDPGHDLCQVSEVSAWTRAGLKDKRSSPRIRNSNHNLKPHIFSFAGVIFSAELTSVILLSL